MNMLGQIFIRLGQVGWHTEQQCFGHSTDLRISFGWIYEGIEHTFALKTVQYRLLFPLLRFLEVQRCARQIRFINSPRDLEFRSEPAKVWFCLLWLFSLQARGKKRQRGWFHSSHVKLLGPSSSKSSPSPLPGEGWRALNTTSCSWWASMISLVCFHIFFIWIAKNHFKWTHSRLQLTWQPLPITVFVIPCLFYYIRYKFMHESVVQMLINYSNYL